MRLLAIDAAGACCSAAVCDGDRPLASRHEVLRRGQAERIVPMVAEAMAAAGIDWSGLDLIAATLGPGTYTGIRAGLAAARGLVLATGLPTLGVSSLEALAACAPVGQALTVVIGGRGETVFVQRFDADGHPVEAPRATERSTLDRCSGPWLDDEEAVDGVAVARAALRAIERGAVPGPGPTLRPLYLREPDLRADAGRPLVGAAA